MVLWDVTVVGDIDWLLFGDVVGVLAIVLLLLITMKLGDCAVRIVAGDSMWGTKRCVTDIGAMSALASVAYCLSRSKRLCLMPLASPFLDVAIAVAKGIVFWYKCTFGVAAAADDDDDDDDVLFIF